MTKIAIAGHILYIACLYQFIRLGIGKGSVWIYLILVFLPQTIMILWQLWNFMTAAREYREEQYQEIWELFKQMKGLILIPEGWKRIKNLSIRAGLIKAGVYPVRAVFVR